MRNRLLLLVACIATGVAALAADTEFTVGPMFTVVKLTASERRDVEQLACVKPHKLLLDSAIAIVGEERGRSDMRLGVRCAPHEKIGNHRVMYTSLCAKKGRELTCEPGTPILFADFGGRRTQVKVRPSGISTKEALDIVNYLDSLGILVPTQDDIFDERNLPYSECEFLSRTGDIFVVECEASEVRVLAIRSEGGVQYRQVVTAPAP